MRHARLTRIRLRLDALRQGAVHQPRLWDQALARLSAGRALAPLSSLSELDRALDRVGVHTSEDAALLKSLGVRTGRAAALARGLAERAATALEEYEDRLRQAERAQLAGAPLPGALTLLEDGFPRLARVLKLADLFEGAGDPLARGQLELLLSVRPRQGPPASARIAVAELWTERARSNTHDLVQKRRDLDAAHELLLRAGGELDRDRIRLLRMEVAQARGRLREAPPARTLAEQVHQVRAAAMRGDSPAAYRALRGLYERAVEAGDEALARAARGALRPILPAPDVLRGLIERAEHEALRGRLGKGGRDEKGRAGPDGALAELAFELDEERLATFELAAGCAGYFDVEDALAEEVELAPGAARPGPRRVPYPTQVMTFETTGSLDELSNFVISDPRTFLYDLASNRQVVRAYLEEPAPPAPRKVRRTAVRVYLCDASGSMHGARARFRDAILIAELNNLRLKAARGERADPLYFSFFNDSPSTLVRVETEEEATRQLERLFRSSPAEGQTRITLALQHAFESIHAARGRDPSLARATVVLVTDGEDRVDPELIRQARAPVGQLDIALSFISLGEENPALRALVLEQRGQGDRAFYHHLSDREIGAARTEFDARFRTLLPPEVPVTPDALARLLPHLDALEQLAAGRPPEDLPPGAGLSFDALFPERPEELLPGAAPASADELARIQDILEAIAEAGSLAPADRRGAESAALLGHLLSLYGLSMSRYLSALARAGGPVRERLATVRLRCRPFG